MLLAEARELGYPLSMLRLNLAAYRGPRQCRVDRACSRAARAIRAAGAGFSHVHGLIKVCTLRALVALRCSHPAAGIRVVVDDVSAQFHGRSGTVAGRAVKFMDGFCVSFEQDLRLRVNRAKTVVGASPGADGTVREKALQRSQAQLRDTGRLLGAGVTTREAAGC